MNEDQIDRDIHVVNGELLPEEALKILGDKVRAVSERMVQLTEEKKSRAEREHILEKEVESLRLQLAGKDQELKKLRAEHTQLLNSSDNNNKLTEEEKENLKNKIRDLIAKINSHL